MRAKKVREIHRLRESIIHTTIMKSAAFWKSIKPFITR